jgi:DNA-binding CsgD family transcriptional regulator
MLNTSQGEWYLLHVLPLNGGVRGGGDPLAGSATAVIFVHKVALKLCAATELAARSYSLSRAESRVLQRLTDGATIPAVALGVAPPTVNTHVAHIFEKTNTRRQADLLKLVAGFVAPHGVQG